MSSNPSPVPSEGAAAGPSPLTIGKKFLKQYYQALINTPDLMKHFYQADESVLSHGEGSNPTECLAFEKYDLQKRWGDAPPKRLELEHGAIDAQPSTGGGILLVVTGHVVLQDTTQAFVHTFLLALVEGTKRYYVHNDVLRFLREAPQSPSPSAKKEDAKAPTLTSEEKKEEEVKSATATADDTPAVAPVEETAPGHGVEETKEVSEEESAEPAAAVVEENAKPDESAPAVTEGAAEKPKEENTSAPAKETSQQAPKEKKGRKKGRSRSPPDQKKKDAQESKPPAPGSWASMAARPAAVAPAAASTPTKAPAPQKPVEKKVEKKVAGAPAKEKESANNNKGGNGGKNKFGKRDPDCTLVIKNLPNDTKEAELLAMFEPFAARTNTKLVGTKLHRGLAFVDYDSVAPVMAAVGDHKKEPMKMGGRTLEVQQKTEEQRTRKNKVGAAGNASKNGKSGGGKGNNNNESSGRRGSGGRDRK